MVTDLHVLFPFPLTLYPQWQCLNVCPHNKLVRCPGVRLSSSEGVEAGILTESDSWPAPAGYSWPLIPWLLTPDSWCALHPSPPPPCSVLRTAAPRAWGWWPPPSWCPASCSSPSPPSSGWPWWVTSSPPGRPRMSADSSPGNKLDDCNLIGEIYKLSLCASHERCMYL